jgi:hypothetical protein
MEWTNLTSFQLWPHHWALTIDFSKDEVLAEFVRVLVRPDVQGTLKHLLLRSVLSTDVIRSTLTRPIGLVFSNIRRSEPFGAKFRSVVTDQPTSWLRQQNLTHSTSKPCLGAAGRKPLQVC